MVEHPNLAAAGDLDEALSHGKGRHGGRRHFHYQKSLFLVAESARSARGIVSEAISLLRSLPRLDAPDRDLHRG